MHELRILLTPSPTSAPPRAAATRGPKAGPDLAHGLPEAPGLAGFRPPDQRRQLCTHTCERCRRPGEEPNLGTVCTARWRSRKASARIPGPQDRPPSSDLANLPNDPPPRARRCSGAAPRRRERAEDLHSACNERAVVVVRSYHRMYRHRASRSEGLAAKAVCGDVWRTDGLRSSLGTPPGAAQKNRRANKSCPTPLFPRSLGKSCESSE